METFLLKLPKKDLVLLQFLLEGYEGISAITTIDPRAAMVRINIMPNFQEEFYLILSELKKTVDFMIIRT